jgi:hypothetical protein
MGLQSAISMPKTLSGQSPRLSPLDGPYTDCQDTDSPYTEDSYTDAPYTDNEGKRKAGRLAPQFPFDSCGD